MTLQRETCEALLRDRACKSYERFVNQHIYLFSVCSGLKTFTVYKSLNVCVLHLHVLEIVHFEVYRSRQKSNLRV